MFSNGKRLPSIWFCVSCNIQYHDSVQACTKCSKTRYENIRQVRQHFSDLHAQRIQKANMAQIEKINQKCKEAYKQRKNQESLPTETETDTDKKEPIQADSDSHCKEPMVLGLAVSTSCYSESPLI